MQYINFFTVLLLFLSVSPGQAQSGNGGAPTPQPCRIVVIGSSTAEGVGVSTADSAWVYRYRRLLKDLHPANEVINLAKGGYQTCHLMPSGTLLPAGRPRPDTLRNITKALSLRPDAIIVNLPSNDVAAGYGVAEQLSNLDSIIRTGLSAGVPVWVCTTQPRHFSSEKIFSQLLVREAIIARYGNRVIDFWEGIAEPNGLIEMAYNSGDGIHLNNRGHRKLFERVVEKNIPAALTSFSQKTKPEQPDAERPGEH